MFSTALFLIAQISPFVLVDRTDPITDERQLALVVVDDENMLAIGCSNPGEGQIFVRFIPKRYFGHGPDAFLWRPNLTHRFGKDEAKEKQWEFYSDHIELGYLWNPNKIKAEFLDALSKNDKLVLRYEAYMGDTKTLVFNYQLNNENLSSIIQKCAPKRVSEYLREWKSPALQAIQSN